MLRNQRRSSFGIDDIRCVDVSGMLLSEQKIGRVFFEPRFKGVSTGFGLPLVEKCFENAL